MPNGPVDPTTLEGDDLAQWYRRPLWQVDQERQAAADRRYADFFGVLRGLPPDTDATVGSVRGQTPASDSHAEPFSGAQSQGRSVNPSKPISANLPTPSTTWLLPIGAQTSAPVSSPAVSSGKPSAVVSHPPNAGIFGSLFPWAVPSPGDGTLKSAMVATPVNPQAGPDPARLDVFQRGADGQLHPILGWHTTGPAEFGTWAREIRWDKVGADIGHIASSVLDVEGAKAAGEAFLDALGPGVKNAVQRGVFGPGQLHHPIPKFMGGAVDQGLADLATPMHREFHKELNAALREAGSPPIGGPSGGTEIWKQVLSSDPANHEKAIGILRRVTRDFDISRGTSITPHLDRELGMVKRVSSPPPK